MAVSQTEQDQVEALNRWWKENYRAIIIGVLFGLILGVAVWAWRDYVSDQADAASNEYGELIGEVEQGDTKAGLARGARIIKQYGDTPYAVLASLAMAKLELDQAKPNSAAARKHLQWALDNAEENNLQHIARLRLAKVLLADAKPKEALTLANAVKTSSFTADYEETKGDAHLALRQVELAQAAYQRALNALDASNTEKRALLEMKLGDLGVRPQEQAKR